MNIKVTLSLIYLLFMSARAVFNPFITLYMREGCLSPQNIGIVTAINSCMIIIAQPFWGIIADKFLSVKKTLVICLCLQAAFSLGLVWSSGFIAIALLFCGYTFFSSPEGPLLDTWSLKTLKKAGDDKAVGQLKLWGCLGFAGCSVMSGIFISSHSAKAAIPIFCVLLVLVAGIISAIRLNAVPEKPISLKSMHLSEIIRDYRFLIFLAYIFVMQMPHRAAYTFYPLLIEHLGGTKMMVGFTSAVMFVSEAALMLISKRLLSKVRAEYLIIASSAFFAIWQYLYSAISHPVQVILIALLDGPSYALFTIGTLYYLDYLAPKQLRTTYQTIAYAVYFGLSGIAGNALGGWCIQNRGYGFMYLSGTLLISAASLCFYLMLIKDRKRSDSIVYTSNM